MAEPELHLNDEWVIVLRDWTGYADEGTQMPVLYHKHRNKNGVVFQMVYRTDNREIISYECPKCGAISDEGVSGYLNVCRWAYSNQVIK